MLLIRDRGQVRSQSHRNRSAKQFRQSTRDHEFGRSETTMIHPRQQSTFFPENFVTTYDDKPAVNANGTVNPSAKPIIKSRRRPPFILCRSFNLVVLLPVCPDARAGAGVGDGTSTTTPPLPSPASMSFPCLFASISPCQDGGLKPQTLEKERVYASARGGKSAR